MGVYNYAMVYRIRMFWTYCLPLWIVINGIVVQQPCQAEKLKPNLTADASVIMLDEAVTSQVTLTELQCADPTGGNPVVSVDNVSPSKSCDNCFYISPCNNNWCLHFTRLEELDVSKVSTYTLTIKCVGSNKQSVKKYIQVRLYKSTKPPEFNSFQRVVTVDDTETQELVLQRITCTDPDDSSVKVDLEIDSKVSKAGCTKCFSIEPCGDEWCLKFTPEVGSLSFGFLPNYPMTLICTDQEGQSVTSDIEVRVTKNSPPHFEKLFVSKTIAGTSQLKAGSKLYTVNATDEEQDTLYYTMKMTPDVPQLSVGYNDGTIVANRDLSQVCTPVVSCEIMVNDGFNPEVGPMVLDLTLEDANVAPSITNMDQTIQVPEDFVVGSTVYRVNIIDEDTFSDLTMTLTASPPAAQGYFELRDNQIVLKSALNYEDPSIRTAQLSLSVTDSGGCISTTKTLTISVTDINEKPEIANPKISMKVYEGHMSFQPEWSIDDEDFSDTRKYRITSGNENGRFTIDPNTGVITSLLEYDVDRGRMPRQVTFTVEVEDKGGLTAEGEVTVNVLDANDNAPFVLGGSQHYIVTECTVPGTGLDVLETNDYDSYYQFNKRAYMLPAKDGPLSLLPSGEVVLTAQMTAGDTASVEGWAVDAGKYPGPLKAQAPVYLTVRCVPCPTSTTTTSPQATTTNLRNGRHGLLAVTTTMTPSGLGTTRSNGIVDNLWWIVMSGLLALGLISLLAWMLWKIRCCQYCSTCSLCTKSTSSSLPKLSKVKPATSPKDNQETNVDLNLRKLPPPPSPLPRSKPPNPAPVLDIPPPVTPEPEIVGSNDGPTYDFWKERYNEDDYISHPDRNSKPEPTKDAVNPLDHQAATKGPTTKLDDVENLAALSSKNNRCVIS